VEGSRVGVHAEGDSWRGGAEGLWEMRFWGREGRRVRV